MPSLKEIFSRIKGVKSTQKTLRVMQMISAAAFKSSQKQLAAANIFAQEVKTNLQILLQNGASLPTPQSSKGEVFIIIGGDRGLCGNFNSSIQKSSIKYQDRNLVCVGNRTLKFFSNPSKIVASFRTPKNKYETIWALAKEISHLVLEFEKATVIYTKFVNLKEQIVHEEQIYPILPPIEGSYDQHEYTFEYLKEVADLTWQQYLLAKLYSVILNSMVSESFMRMVAMDNANKNTNEMLGALLLKYNSIRQSIVTKDIIEIISGAETEEA